MNDLDTLLNGPDGLKQTTPAIPQPKEKPTPAANKAHGLAEQDLTIASASIGSHIYRSPATFLTDNPEVKGYKKESVPKT